MRLDRATPRVRRVGGVFVLGLSVILSATATAQHGHGHGHHGHSNIDVIIGAPFLGAWYGYSPYVHPYRYLPVIAAPAPIYVESAVAVAPPVYIERAPAVVAAPPAVAAAPGYWYYCAASAAYYPYVKECPAGWQPIAPTPGS